MVAKIPSALTESAGDELSSEFIDEHVAAQMLDKAPQTLRTWRSRRIHLPFYRHGGSIRYKREDVLRFRESGRIEPTGKDRVGPS